MGWLILAMGAVAWACCAMAGRCSDHEACSEERRPQPQVGDIVPDDDAGMDDRGRVN